MKKQIFLYMGILCTAISFGQSHSFDNNEEDVDNSGSGIHWILTDWKISVTSHGDTYNIVLSKDSAGTAWWDVWQVRFSKLETEEQGWFRYDDLSRKFKVETNVKLSDMCKGKGGIIRYYCKDFQSGFKLSNY